MTFSEWKTIYPNLTAFYTPNEEAVTVLSASNTMVVTKLFVSQLRDSNSTAFESLSGQYRFEYWDSYNDKIIFSEYIGGSSNHSDGDRILKREYAPTAIFEVLRGGRVFGLVSFPKEKAKSMLDSQFDCRLVLRPGDHLQVRVAWPLITRHGDRDKTTTALTPRQRNQLNTHVGRLNVIAQGVVF